MPPLSANPALRVRFRGVRGSTPSPGSHTARYGGNTACVELRAGEEILILDAGSGIRQLGADLIGEFGDKRAIEATLLISHTHWDHIQGLPFFAPAFSSNNAIRVLGANGMRATIECALRNQMQPIHFPVGLEHMTGLTGIEELAAKGETIGTFVVTQIALNHPGGCAGFRIEAGGVAVAYLPDHEPFESLCLPGRRRAARLEAEAVIDFVRGVDLLILDTQYTETEYPGRIGWGHGCLSDSVALAMNAGVQQLALFHHEPSHDDTEIEAMVERARYLARTSKLRVIAASEEQALEFSSAKFQTRDSAFYPLIESAA